jgi:hypothetical protein
MKSDKSKNALITAPVLKDLMDWDNARQKANREQVAIGSKPLSPPSSYEDAGAGYNSNYTYPQQ